MQILITAGGTEEPIDGVRTISNFSTGRTGATIADFFQRAGMKVTLLTSLRGFAPTEDVDVVRYQSFDDLNTMLMDLLGSGNYKGVIHAAAVSDYSVDYLISDGNRIEPDNNLKLNSELPLTIELKPNFKILGKLKSYSKSPLIVVGFKLTKNGTDELIKSKVSSQFRDSKVDYVVHNDLTNINRDRHLSSIYKNNEIFRECSTKIEMAKALFEIYKEEVK